MEVNVCADVAAAWHPGKISGI